MASEPKASKRLLKQPETVRQRAENTTAAKPKKRRVRKTAGAFGKLASKLGFILKPFRIRPIRFVLVLIGRILFPRFFRNAFREVRLVEWPKRKETAKLTFAVVVFAVIFSFVISITDYGLDKVFRKVLLK